MILRFAYFSGCCFIYCWFAEPQARHVVAPVPAECVSVSAFQEGPSAVVQGKITNMKKIIIAVDTFYKTDIFIPEFSPFGVIFMLGIEFKAFAMKK